MNLHRKIDFLAPFLDSYRVSCGIAWSTVPEHSESPSVPDTRQPHPENFPGQVFIVYFNKGNYEEINMINSIGYA